jgi:integrase
MSLRTRNGKWHFRFRLDGRDYQATTDLAATRANATAAQRLEVEYRNALLEGRRPTLRVTVREFRDAVREFSEWTKMRYRAHPASGQRIMTSLASALRFFASMPVSMIDEARIEAYKTWRVNEHQVRDVTLRHDLHSLSTFFQFAIKMHWTRDNPILRVEIPSDAGAVRIYVLDADEEKRYFARAARHRNLYDLGRLLLNQGCRPEEVTALGKADVDLERGQLHIRGGKTDAARRTLDLTPESRRILASRMAGDSRWIFPAKRKPGEHVTRLNSAHDRVCEKGGFSFVLYDLRHTFATRMAQAGIDLATLAALLGHNGLRVVQKYVHPTAGHKKAAMEKYAATMQPVTTRDSGRIN